ncbi:hypothetical protein [Parabacteroides distasonis]|uniref:hypothetical protein n=1 Tax=Parabacteroides distasonis TaxID=823 RepID=UPI0018A10EA9|nr:hypothetical protein [Parabacteroides distasonis]MDB9152336.1 hypothetical protein [Parabacteroides distasonis]MDB9158053.1 hypothetical protein [Parabacteroides distasonis]MDB9165926.1 hypothetical protein [Parabacteroides distasonis]MDB9171288.1 hypothetical protein [Parabacteroides distasonis]MDB9196367.1 hypothetical protein [Parabacteroides distasonis]
MKYFGAGLSESHKELNRIIRKPELIEQAKELFLEIHGKLHLTVVSGNERNEVDELVGDFWAKKDIAGILLMPPTRHVMLHLNDCCKWKLTIRGKHYKNNLTQL